jgi:hypothetical protein
MKSDTAPTADPTKSVELQIVKGETSGLFVLTETGIEIAEDMSFGQWQEGLKAIKWFRTKLSIGFADYVSWGTKKFGEEKVGDALEQLEFEATLVKAAVAINQIPLDLRFPNLTGDHYVELAKADLSRAKATKWARVAFEQGLTPSQLKFSIVEGEVVGRDAARALSSGVVTIQGIRQQFDVWMKRMNGLEGVLKLERDHQEEILGELEAMAALWGDLKEHLSQPVAAEA